MAHLFIPQRPDPVLPVFFNVDGVVGGIPAQNLREDVLLVQFFFKVCADFPLANTSPEVSAALRVVRVTGTIDGATISAIMAVQESEKRRSPNQVVDGRVSPVKGGYSHGAAFWIIVHLNHSVQQRNLDIWPRIDKIPGCPAELRQMVVRTVAGS